MIGIELLLDSRATIGESPTWSAGEQALYWIDVKQPALYRRHADGSTRCWHTDADIGAFALLQDAFGAVVALRTGLFRLDFPSGAMTRLVESPFDPALFRFNEGICDAAGRCWVGVMFDPLTAGDGAVPGKGALHQFTFERGLVAAADESELHNGFAWNANNSEFFWSHSRTGKFFRAAYDLTTGTMGRAKPFIDTGDTTRVPDGAAMDEDGCYWCAIHGAGVLRRYDAGGRLISEIALPVSQPTMCAFTGTDLNRMIVTSARQKLSPEQLAREPQAGGVFQLDPGVRGLPRPCVVH